MCVAQHQESRCVFVHVSFFSLSFSLFLPPSLPLSLYLSLSLSPLYLFLSLSRALSLNTHTDSKWRKERDRQTNHLAPLVTNQTPLTPTTTTPHPLPPTPPPGHSLCLQHAMAADPAPLTDNDRYRLSWDAATGSPPAPPDVYVFK